MARATHLQASFSGGEFAPHLEGRVDLARYATSCRAMSNFLPTVEGPAAKRPGTRFVVPGNIQTIGESGFGSTSRLIPFVFSRTQAYVLEFVTSNLYFADHSRIRVYRNNSRVLDGAQTVTAITVGATTLFTTSVAHKLLVNDTVHITAVGGTLGPRVNNRSFRVATVPLATTFTVAFDSTGLTETDAGTVNQVYEIRAPYLEGELAQIGFAQSADVLFLDHPNHVPRKLLRYGDNDWMLTEALGGELADAIPISTITAGTTVTTTVPHGLKVNDKILFERVQGMREVNGGTYNVSTVGTATTFVYNEFDGNINTGGFHDAVNAFTAGTGYVRRFVNHDWPAFAPENLNDDDLVVCTGSVRKGETATVYTSRNRVANSLQGNSSYLKLREVIAEEHSTWKEKSAVIKTDDTGTVIQVGGEAFWAKNVYELISKGGGGSTGETPPIHEIEGERQLDHKWTWEFAHKGEGFLQFLGVHVLSAPSGGGGARVHQFAGVVRRRLPESCFDPNAVISTSATSIAGSTVRIGVASTANLVDGDRVLLYDFTIDPGLNGRLVYVDVFSATQFDAYHDVARTLGLQGVGAGAGGNVIRMTNATKRWSEFAWNPALRGAPRALAFFEDRLWHGGSGVEQQTVWGSESGNYESHDAHDPVIGAVSFALNTQEQNAIEWLHSRRQLMIGTQGGEFVASGQTPEEPVSSENVLRPLLMTTYGVRPAVRPLQIGNVLLFAQRAGGQVREFVFDTYNSDEYKASDVSLLSAHLFVPRVSVMAFQQTPQPLVWTAMDDGSLAVCCYDRTQEVVGWARVKLGGAYQGGPAQVESVAIIPHPDGDQDQVWLVVKRTVNGVDLRHIEFLEKPFVRDAALAEIDDLAANARFVDAGLVYSGGPITAVEGLDHLEGQSVQVLADGRYAGVFTVAAGKFTLTSAASKVAAGLAFGGHAVLETSRIESGGADGTAQGKFKNIRNAVLRLHDTGPGLYYGRDPAVMDRLPMTTDNDPSARGVVVMMNGDTRELELPGDVNDIGRVRVEHREPFPCTLVASIAQTGVEDD